MATLAPVDPAYPKITAAVSSSTCDAAAALLVVSETTLLHELELTGGRYGLQTMCEGGGQANVTVIERLG